VLSGSLPRGVAASFYAELVDRLRALRVRVAVDTSGPALAAVAAAAPTLLKPNAEELAELAGRALPDWGAVAAEAERLRASGVDAVLVSLGPDGALLVDGDGVRRAFAAPVEVASTVGAGDSTLAGFLLHGGAGDDALRAAVAFGTAAVTLPGSQLPGPADVRLDDVVLDPDPDLSRPLTGAAA
jgi:1-phosphofructokinase